VAFSRAVTITLLLCAVLLAASCGGGSSSSSGSNREYTLYLTVTPNRLNISDGGSAAVRVDLYDSDGNPVGDATVTLTTTLGTLGATSVTTGADGTAEAGSASTTLTPGTTVGNATVTATFGSITVYSDLIEFYEPLA
jgi:hypothetical protein